MSAKPARGARARAIALIIDVERGAFSNERLSGDDGAFVRELVLGVLRRRLTLDSVYAAFGRRALDDLDDDVRAALRLGLYQLLFMDGVPPHAAVAATVDAVRSGAAAQGAGARAYVNALLRTVLRESHRVAESEDRGGASPRKRLHRPGRCVIFFSRPVFPDPEHDRAEWLAAVHSHPALLVRRWIAQVGEDAAVARMEAGNAPAPLVLRPRQPRATALSLAEALAREGVATQLLPRAGGGGDALIVRSGAGRALASRAFREGLFAVQDSEQMDAAEILDLRAGENVWDACAAPGSKTAQLAERLEMAEGTAPRGRVLATDGSGERLERVRENALRLGLRGVEVVAHDLLGGAPPPQRPARGFDAILLDAPCSNTAVLARRPEARWRLRAETFAELAAQQRRMLGAACAHLAEGGRLVYSVCTHEPEEGAAHGLRATRSPYVFTATRAELQARVAAWEHLPSPPAGTTRGEPAP